MLDPDTRDYFVKLPGQDTLRLILSRRAVLVEGPSDELIVQRAFAKKFGRMPLEMGVDVITVNSLAFRRFLEIADLLDLEVDVLTDNDGDLDALLKKYEAFNDNTKLNILYDPIQLTRRWSRNCPKANSLATINNILGRNFDAVEPLRWFTWRRTRPNVR